MKERQEILCGVGDRLASIRGSQSQAYTAELTGIHKNTIGTYERGQREMGIIALHRLIEAGWNANWILTGEGPERLDQIAVTSPTSGQDEPYIDPDTGLSHRMRLDVFKIAVELVDSELTKHKRGLGSLARAEAYSIVYDLLMDDDDLPSADIVELRPRAKSIVKGAMAVLLRAG